MTQIVLWYGQSQRFGHLGEAQRWINVLGHVEGGGADSTAEYRLNHGAWHALCLGPDRHRLAAVGDFNIELSWEDLSPGDNDLEVRVCHGGHEVTRLPATVCVERRRRWVLPWHVDFAATEEIQDVVQVVDGHWQCTDEGVRTLDPYYDRVLCVGDASWTDYEAWVKLTIHDFTDPVPGPPTYGVTHMGVAMRWRGHHVDGLQPSRRWHPLGAQGEFLLQRAPAQCRWRILLDHPHVTPLIEAEGGHNLALGEPLWIRAQVVSEEGGSTCYRFRQWKDGTAEPDAWDVVGVEADDVASGALCLVPHNADVTIHSLSVTPLGAITDQTEEETG